MRHVLILAVWAILGSDLYAQEAKPASPAPPKITYDEHVRPILREHCFSCHSADKQESGLALDTYQKTMTGGSSGEIVIAGDLASSRLWALASHKEEPKMPPRQDKLASAKLDLLSKWIEQGAPENSGSKVVQKANPLAVVSTGGAKPAGRTIMPVGLLKQPVQVTARAGQVTALAASPFSPLLAVAGQKQIVLWNTDDGSLLGILPFPEGVPYCLHFSRNGSVLLAGGGRGGHSGCVALYDVATGKRLATIGDELDAVLAADISADQSRVALGGPSRAVRIYSVQTGEVLHEIRKHTDWVNAIEFSPQGDLLATADRSGGVFVWEAATARESLNLRGHTGGVWDLNWRHDDKVLATAGEDGTIKLWDKNEGTALKSWTAHAGGAFCVRFAEDGRLATCGRDNSVKSWAADGAAIKTYPSFTESALRCAFSHDGQRVIAGDWLGNIRAWEAVKGAELFSFTANPPTLAMRLVAARQELATKQQAAADAAAKTAEAGKLLAERESQLKAAAAEHAAKKSAAEKAQAALEKAKAAEQAAASDERALQQSTSTGP